MAFELTDPDCAYVFGFMHADGHHRSLPRNCGSVSLIIKATDKHVLYDMQRALPWPSKVRVFEQATYLSPLTEFAELIFWGLEGRRRFLELGMPTGPKSKTIAPPPGPFSRSDYLRGLWDGDGSVGFTRDGNPYMSLATASPAMAEYVCGEILHVTGRRRTVRPSARYSTMNILVKNDAAVSLARWLYGDARIALQRKREAALAVAAWTWPPGRYPRSTPRAWTAEEDAVILQDIPEKDAAKRLGRTVPSVNSRRRKLRCLEAA